jgi:hypothetical protein
MSTIFLFLLKAYLCSGVFYLYYYIFLRNTKLHKYNRFYLLLSIPASLLLPLVNLKIYSLFILPPNEPINSQYPQNNADLTASSFAWQVLPAIIILIVSLWLLIVLCIRIYRIMTLLKTHTVQRMDGFFFIESDIEQAPFSFFDKLFWKTNISVRDPAGERIFMHELAHIRQLHSYDKIFTQVVCCIFWTNPIYRLIQNELSLVHEFLADEASIDDGDSQTFAEMLLCSVNNGRYLEPSNPFFNSSVQRRLNMIICSQKPGHSFARRFLILPSLIVVVGLLSCTVRQKTTNITGSFPTKRQTVAKKPSTTGPVKPGNIYNSKTKTKNSIYSRKASPKKQATVEFAQLITPEKSSSPPDNKRKYEGNLSPDDIRTIKNGNSRNRESQKGYSQQYSPKPGTFSETTKESVVEKSSKEDGYPGKKF